MLEMCQVSSQIASLFSDRNGVSLTEGLAAEWRLDGATDTKTYSKSTRRSISDSNSSALVGRSISETERTTTRSSSKSTKLVSSKSTRSSSKSTKLVSELRCSDCATDNEGEQ